MHRRNDYDDARMPRRRDERPPLSTSHPPRRSLPNRPRPSEPTSSRRSSPHRARRQDGEEEYLSADAATRIMMEKWDLLDLDNAREPPDEEAGPRRGRLRRPDRASSLPATGMKRTKSRVREWEEWKPEMERIRLAQVEMEERLEEEAKAHQLASIGNMEESDVEVGEPCGRAEETKRKSRERKSTPRYPTLKKEEEEESGSDGLSPSRHSSNVATRAVYEEIEVERRPRSRRSNRPRGEAQTASAETAPSRSSRHARRPAVSPSSISSENHQTQKERKSSRAVSAPLPTHTEAYRSRSSRRKSRPPSPDPILTPSSAIPSPSPAPRPSRSSRNRPRPSSSSPPSSRRRPVEPTSSTEPDLLASASQAAEQVSEAVTNALYKVLPGWFGGTKSDG